jgi:hypothetical protein
MIPLTPRFIYVTTDLQDHPAAMARVERMIAACPGARVEFVDDEGLSAAVTERGWDQTTCWGTQTAAERHDPDLVLTTGKFHDEATKAARLERYPGLRFRDLGGYRMFWWRYDGSPEFREKSRGIICQSAWQLHSIEGCPFRCWYCGCGGVNRLLMNVEEYLEHLDEWLQVAPAQRLYKWDNSADVTAFEPEYGWSTELVKYFARQPGKFLEIYVGKSDNIENLLSVDPRGQTILQWSISARTQSTVIEEKTATWEERIEAARACQEAGYLVRFRFSPIIPVPGWREENTELIERIFARTRPDVISLCPFGWMNATEFERRVPFDLLDPDFAAVIRAAEPFLAERGYSSGGAHPIPHDARLVLLDYLIDEIQRVGPGVPIALCLETPEMWARLGPKLGQPPGRYVCNCGPTCTPGDALYDAAACRGGQ